jgi:hypothetical protein
VRPGHEAGYVIWVWSTRAASKDVTVSVRIASVRHVDGPHFTVCPSSGASACKIGTLPTGQADELQAASWVRRAAVNGEQIDLTASASGKNTDSYAASGSVVVTAAAKTPASSTSPPAPTSTVTLPPGTIPPTSTGTGNPAAGLFPTVSPSPSTSGIGFPSAKKTSHARAVTAAAIVPLSPRLIGGQLAGLAVLGGAIMIAIARLSLRKPRPQDGPEDKGAQK